MTPGFIARRMLILLCALGAFASFATPALAAGRLALVIGNSAYRAAPALDNPANDAADLAEALRAIGFDVIERDNASREDMASAVRDFSGRIRNADTALFYYAGHGLQMNGENYLLPVDASIESEADVRFNAINLTDIQQEMDDAGRANIIILDACRNNPFTEKLAHSGRGIVSRGLGRMEATGVGSLVVFSTQPNNVALDGAGRNSPFASALLRHIAAPGLEVRQMISKVRGDVLQATGQKQVPWDNSSLVGEVYLAGSPIADTPPAQPPTQASSADASAQPRDASTTPSAAGVDSGPADECEKLTARAPYFATPEQIRKANQPQDRARALEVCQRALGENANEPRLHYKVGLAYFNLKNYLEAAHHYAIAADAGYVEAQDRLGYMYVTGSGVVKDYKRAFDLFSKAAAGGSAAAMGNLGSMYSNGYGVKEDDAMALAWYQKSIEAGNPFGLAQAGVMYFDGKGTPRDYDAARQYFEQAGDLYDGFSLKFLALMYERGLLGAPDPAKAAQLRLRAAQVDPESQDPDVPLPRATAARATRPAVRHIRIYRYRFIGCSWVWC